MKRYDEAFCQDVFHITRKAVCMELDGLIEIDDRNGLFFTVMDLSREFYAQHDPADYDGDNYLEDIEQFAEKKLEAHFGMDSDGPTMIS